MDKPVIGWEAIGATTHPRRRESVLAERIWQARDSLIERGWFDFEGLEMLANVASKLETAVPSDSDLIAHATNILQEIGG